MGLFNRSGKNASTPASGGDEVFEGTPVRQQKAEILEAVKLVAMAEGCRPTLVNYLSACKAYMPQSTEWSPKIWADMSGQNLQGFEISDPSKATDTEHVMANLYDQFGTGTVNEFYSNVSFHEANLKDALVAPSTSFLIAEKSGAKIDGITFDGMRNNEQFIIGAGEHKDIHITNVNGGTIIADNGAHLKGVEISGTQGSIAFRASAVVSGAKIRDGEDFRIIKFEGEPGAVLRDSDLGNATISQASLMQGMHIENVTFGNASYVSAQGATLKNVTINGHATEAEFQMNAETGTAATLDHVTINGNATRADFTNAELKNVAINGDVKEANFDGANIRDLTVNGTLIKNAEDLQALTGREVDAGTKFSCSPEALAWEKQRNALEKAAIVREDSVAWIKEATATPVPATVAEQTKAPFIGMPSDQQIQQGPVMAATNDNALADMPTELGQNRAQAQAKGTQLGEVVWQDKAVAANGQNVSREDVNLQSNLKNLVPGEGHGIA